jgi:HSP20 family protein
VIIFGGNSIAETLRLSPVISAYPDDEYENLLIEVILPGVEKKTSLLRSMIIAFT